jgi:hypothetical protein
MNGIKLCYRIGPVTVNSAGVPQQINEPAVQAVRSTAQTKRGFHTSQRSTLIILIINKSLDILCFMCFPHYFQTTTGIVQYFQILNSTVYNPLFILFDKLQRTKITLSR